MKKITNNYLEYFLISILNKVINTLETSYYSLSNCSNRNKTN